MLERKDVMLAYPATENKVNNLGDIFLTQPKLRGQRMRTEFVEKKPYLISAFGNPFYFMEHIEEELKRLAYNGYDLPFDGELYKHNWSQEKINSAANRTKNRSPVGHELEYHIFDIQFTDVKQYLRLALLNKIREFIFQSNEKFNFIKIVPTYTATRKNWMQYTVEFVDDNYEGIILREPNAYYVPKRVSSLLKYKPTEIDKYRIVGVNEAIDKNGKQKNMVGSFIVEGGKNDTFCVGAGKMPHKMREVLWQDRYKILGKSLEVKHEKIKTENDIPLCCVAISVVNYYTVGQ